MKILQIVGARPQFIKYSPVFHAIQEYNGIAEACIQDVLVHTGQHYDYTMSETFFREFGLKEPDHHLGVGSGLHGEQTGKILRRVEHVLQEERPDVLVVYGDTNSTLGGALAAAKAHVPVVHVEAGLRSFNKEMPEEINRILTDHASSLLLCPSEKAVHNLRLEGFSTIVNDGALLRDNVDLSMSRATISRPLVVNTGDVMYDVLLQISARIGDNPHILKTLGLVPHAFGVLTIHRAENTDNMQKLREIITFINDTFAGETLIFPAHPRTVKALQKGGIILADNIKQINPLGYSDMIALTMKSRIVLTDSGGLQKEAFWLKIPCITLREETEWEETCRSGWNLLYKDYQGRHIPHDPGPVYGDGRAASRIVTAIVQTAGLKLH